MHGVRLDFSQPGRITNNGMIEAFNGRLRADCLNENWFVILDDAKEKIEDWRRHYEEDCPHSALGSLAPRELAANQARECAAG